MEWRFILTKILMVMLCSVPIIGPGYDTTNRGFFMVSNMPQIGRHNPLYIYAIHDAGDEGEFSIGKDGGLPSSVVETGQISIFGCYLRVADSDRYSRARYGQYTGGFLPASGDPALTGYTFVKPRSRLLDTRGVYTVTIYPDAEDSMTLVEPVSIGVRWSPGCQRIVWCKGKRRNFHKGPRLTLRSTEDAGLYTISQPGRSKRGYFVHILVTAASCPRGQFFSTLTMACAVPNSPCLNGGVPMDRTGSTTCICPVLFVGTRCECAVGGPTTGPTALLLSDNGPAVLYCRDLPGGNPTCKGHLFCYGDNLGCLCASGWYGNACDRPCPKGRYGGNCEQRCPPEELDCDRFKGPSSIQDGECND